MENNTNQVESSKLRAEYLNHISSIVCECDVNNDRSIRLKGNTLAERLALIEKMKNDLDSIGQGLDESIQDANKYQIHNHNSAASIIASSSQNPHKYDLVYHTLKSYFSPTSGKMRNGHDEIYDSYLLKHMVEDVLTYRYGYSNPTINAIDNAYISNGEIKGAMLALGYSITSDSIKSINWSFNTKLHEWLKMQDDINKLKSTK